MAISTIRWAVAPSAAKGLTRPERMAAELRALGAISPTARVHRHGTGAGSPVGQLLRLSARRAPRPGDEAVLSPAYLQSASERTVWIDLYDDWSIAPDVSRPLRALSALGYERLCRGGLEQALLTVNSEYLANKLAAARPVLIPNGVDEELGGLPLEGDDASRLVVLGHFFRGRTDFGLLRQIAGRSEFDEVIIGGPGESAEMNNLISDLKRDRGSAVVIAPWLKPEQLARLAGRRTVALIPHAVSDYTRSQDLMKAYQFLALGIRVICPRLLWPTGLSARFAFLIDHGVILDGYLADWIESDSPSEDWRLEHASEHSWSSRAAAINQLLVARRARA